jgi:hypothetical protein
METKMKRLVYLIASITLIIIAGLSILIGPLSSVVSATTVSGGGGPTSPGLYYSMNWVNECTISGSVTDVSNDGLISTTNLTLTDPSCIQNWDQNGDTSVTKTYQFFDNSTCSQSIIWANAYHPDTAIVQGTINYLTPDGTCTQDNFTSSNSFKIGNDSNANIVYFEDGGSIYRVDGNTNYTFTQDSSHPNIYLDNTDLAPCLDTIVVTGTNNAKLYELTAPLGSSSINPSSVVPPSDIYAAKDCVLSNNVDDVNGPTTSGTPDANNTCTTSSPVKPTRNPAKILNPTSTSNGVICSEHPQNNDGSFTLNLGDASNASPGTGSSNSAESNEPACAGGPLSWLTCAVINGISTLEAHLENVVKEALHIQPIDLNPSDCQSGDTSQNYTACVYSVWSQFRIYGDILLVLVLLVVIIAEAAGGGAIDAYTIRKILPRILVTAILINLSIYIVAGLVDITNIIGQGIFSLITEPFKEANTYRINISGTGGFLSSGGTILGVIGVGGGIWKLASVGGLGDAVGFLALFVGLPALLAIIGVILTIFFRTVLIIFLLMVSPLAFALYCLPNTEQYFRKWWDLLFRTLMVYPIIMVMFAMCSVGAVVVSSFVPGKEQWLGDLLTIVGVSAPLFLIPFAFKISGGVVGSIYGGLSNINKRVSETIKGNVNDQNSLRNRTRRRLNIRRAAAGLSGAAIGTRLNPSQIYSSTARKNARARLSAHRQSGLEQLRRQEEETGIFRAAQGDSNIMRELAYYSSGREARAAADKWRQVAPGIIDQKLRDGEITPEQAEEQKADIPRIYDQRNAAIAVAERIGYNPATRRAALLNQYNIGFEAEQGENGWQEAMAAAWEISGHDNFQFRSIQDEFQAIAKGPAGRVDLAGNSGGSRVYNGNRAWGSGGLYQIGQGKPRAVKGSSDYFYGVLDRLSRGIVDDPRDIDFQKEAQRRGVDTRVVMAEAVGTFYAETKQLANSATGGVRDEAITAHHRFSDGINTLLPDDLLNQQLTQDGLTRAPGTSKADALANLKEVKLKTRAYEPPDRQGGEGGGFLPPPYVAPPPPRPGPPPPPPGGTSSHGGTMIIPPSVVTNLGGTGVVPPGRTSTILTVEEPPEPQNQREQPESQDHNTERPIGDIVNIDSQGRGHVSGSHNDQGRNRNGQFLSNREMGLIEENQDQIRDNPPPNAEGEVDLHPPETPDIPPSGTPPTGG